MEAESSPFESSEMAATFLASTPFLEKSWRLCSLANSSAAPPRGFVAARRGEVGCLAFSGVKVIDGSEPSCGTLMALGEFGCERLFSPLRCDGDGDGEGTVKIQELLGKVEMIILTGHSFGATTASLTALWLLSQLQPIAFPISVLCLTSGTPLLGNESLSRAILRERWGGSFNQQVFTLWVVSLITVQDDNIMKPAKDCLQMARHMGHAPNLNNAHLAIRLSKIMPCKAQLEWYKACCDESKDQLGCCDTFQQFEASRRESMVNLNLFLLAAFGMMSNAWQNKINSCTISTACPIGLICPISMGC